MTTHRYHQWCLTFTDPRERNPSHEDERGRGYVEQDLSYLYLHFNALDGTRSGFIDTDNIFLLRRGEDYQYVTFFNLKGDDSIGLAKMMFTKAKKQMMGIKMFEE